VFLPDGTLVPLPNLAAEPFLEGWEQAVLDLLLAAGKITEEIVANIRSWGHSGCSVDPSVRIEAEDTDGVQKLIEYFLRCRFSQARRIEVTGEGTVLYKTGHNRLGRFAEAASENLLPGPKRNFQVFDPLDFLAEVTQHIPDPGEHWIGYDGWYSNKTRGLRAKGQPAAVRPAEQKGPGGREARKRWAALIQQVYQVNPWLCPRCSGTMKIISFIERHQSEVIRRRSSSYGGTSREDSAALWALGTTIGPGAAGGSSRALRVTDSSKSRAVDGAPQ
jgi:hypothetical protein